MNTTIKPIFIGGSELEVQSHVHGQTSFKEREFIQCLERFQIETGETLTCSRENEHQGFHHSCCEECGVSADERRSKRAA